MPEETTPATTWAELTGGTTGPAYAARFDKLAASGQDVHGEASFCATLVAPPSTVLDAGCGTGRVAIRLAELGYDVVGVDADRSMLEVARSAAPHLRWLLADVSTLTLPERFALIVAAGNVVPLLAEGTLDQTIAGLARLLTPGGQLVCGFGLDAAHLPPRCPVTELTAYDVASERAGLRLAARYSTWDGEEFVGQEYAVSVHRRD